MQAAEISNIARYDRQNLIQGWDQEKLEKARVGIIGAGPLGQMAAVPLAALGFGHIEIYDAGKVSLRNRDDFLCARAGRDASRLSAVEEMLRRINPSVDVRGIGMVFSQQYQASVFNSLDLIIDCTNSPYSKLIALEYGRANKKPVITAASSALIGELGISRGSFDESYFFPEYAQLEQKASTAMVIGGLIADEARKLVMPLNDRPLERIISYNRRSKERTGYAEDIEISPKKTVSDMHIVLVGAGALGNFVGLGLAIQGAGQITIFDDDDVEETNLNRQVLFYDSVGRGKAESLVEKLAEINPGVEYEPRRQRVGLNFGKYIQAHNPSLIIDCVDNHKTRALLNYFARTMNVPLIGGGTDFKSGQAAVYVPGKTSCLQCQLTIDDLALQSYRPQSCIFAAEPSVIISNQIIGGLIVSEVNTIFAPDKYGDPIRGILKYDSTTKERIGMLGSRGACSCHEQDKQAAQGWLKKMKKLYQKGG